MPNQTDPNQVADTTSTPPVSVPNTDLPPLPDFMNVPASPTSSEPQTSPTDDSSGSAAPSDLPPVVGTPKKKFGGGKIIATILGLVLLVGGIGAGVVLTQQQQLFQQKAAPAPECGGTCTCTDSSGHASVNGTCSDSVGNGCGCKCSSGLTVSSSNCALAVVPPGGTTTTINTSNICTQTNRSCGNCGTQSCTAIGGLAIWGSCTGEGCTPGKTETCTTTVAGGATTTGSRTCGSNCQWGSCSSNVNVTPITGGTTCECNLAGGSPSCASGKTCVAAGTNGTSSCVPSGSIAGMCAATGTGTSCECNLAGGSPSCKSGTCVAAGTNGTSSCVPSGSIAGMCTKPGVTGGVCMPSSGCNTAGCSGSSCSTGGITGSDRCFVSHYWCQTRSPGGCSSNLIEKGSSASFSKTCGTEQIDIYCEPCCMTTVKTGTYVSKTYDSDCEGAPGAPMCTTVKAYDPSWGALNSAQLSALSAGAQVNFCVSGSAPSGTFDKAQFTIKGVQQAETTTVRPSSTDFCQSYTILSTDTTVGVTAKIHHSTLGWY